MKKIIILICGLLVFTCACAQNKISGISTYFSQYDSISLTKSELNYLLKSSYVVCSKIDTLDDGGLIKTVEIACKDTTFRFVGAYIESEIFFINQCVADCLEKNLVRLKCELVVIDNGQLYESYELDTSGKLYFEKLLNKVPLLCVATYQ